MRKKTPNDYLSSFANSKLIADMAKRQREQEERLARLELAQKQNEDKFGVLTSDDENVGTVLRANCRHGC